MPEKRERWYNCQQPRKPKQWKPRKEKPAAPPPFGYPSVLLILSHFMWGMSWVGLILATLGTQWKRIGTWWTGVTDLWKALKLITWPDPKVTARKKKHLGKKRLLMLALAIAVKKANVMPHIDLLSGASALQRLRSRRGKNGLLMTGNLNNEELRVVRDAVAAMPGELVQKGDSKLVIVDTGCTISASGDQSDFESGSLKKMDEEWALQGIGGSLKATHEGMMRMEVVTDH
jgi:hypothetical protein